MTAEELDLLAKEIATLDECDPDYDAHLLHILNAAPALIALAEWAEKHGIVALKDWRHADGCFCEASFAGPGCHPSHSDECRRAMDAIAAYPNDMTSPARAKTEAESN